MGPSYEVFSSVVFWSHMEQSDEALGDVTRKHYMMTLQKIFFQKVLYVSRHLWAACKNASVASSKSFLISAAFLSCT